MNSFVPPFAILLFSCRAIDLTDPKLSEQKNTCFVTPNTPECKASVKACRANLNEMQIEELFNKVDQMGQEGMFCYGMIVCSIDPFPLAIGCLSEGQLPFINSTISNGTCIPCAEQRGNRVADLFCPNGKGCEKPKDQILILIILVIIILLIVIAILIFLLFYYFYHYKRGTKFISLLTP